MSSHSTLKMLRKPSSPSPIGLACMICDCVGILEQAYEPPTDRHSDVARTWSSTILCDSDEVGYARTGEKGYTKTSEKGVQRK
jgi:hypothetical protein